MYGSVVGSTLTFAFPIETSTFPIEALAPEGKVDPAMITPPPSAFSTPCPFTEAKAPVGAADGMWIALPPITTPPAFCAICTPLVVVELPLLPA